MLSMRPLSALLFVALAGCSATAADRLGVQCHEARANLTLFCSPECRMAYTMAARSCMSPDVPASLYECLNATAQVEVCPGLTFTDCDVFADCAQAQPAEIQQRLFDSEGCFRAAVAADCE